MARAWLLLCVVAVPLGSAGPWLHESHDPARTGRSLDAGPEYVGPGAPDVAFHVQLPGARVRDAPVLVRDGHAYVLQGQGQRDSGNMTLWDIDTATGSARALATFPLMEFPAGTMAADAQRIYVGDEARATAIEWSGRTLWETAFGKSGTQNPTACATALVADGLVLFGCAAFALSSTVNVAGGRRIGNQVPFVVALDAQSGQEVWRWEASVLQDWPAEDPYNVLSRVSGLSAFGGRVFVGIAEVHHAYLRPEPGVHAVMVHALDLASGELQWSHTVHPEDGVLEGALGAMTVPLDGGVEPVAFTGSGDELYVKGAILGVFDAATGEHRWNLALRQGDEAVFTGHAIALVDGSVLVTSYRTLYKVDLVSRSIVWERPLFPGASWTGVPSIVVAGGTVYAAASTPQKLLVGIDFETGEPRFQVGLHQDGVHAHPRYGVSDNLLVVARDDGNVTVYGRAPAGIQLDARPVDAYPARRARAAVDVSQTRPGAHDRTTEFRVTWPDGGISDWSTATRFERPLDVSGEAQVLVQARNAAGQQASQWVVFHVGASPPVRPNLLQQAFAPERLDLTFGVLGLAVAGGGALLALTLRRRRRSRLRDELAAIDALVGHAHGDAAEAAVRERRARVRDLLADHRLDQGDLLLLERRLDEWSQRLALDAIEERFPFLSAGMARHLRTLMADGRLTRLEHEHFVAALDRDTSLTGSQRRRVRAQIDAWARAASPR